ncbi:exonuclease SbcCD subunit D [Terrilactibacillus laevilacticus]|uniref:Nuclease SbcCD subunit D n=1 Tax=Terrilactibacillus laevilacticus TaxID=1380157 RepID=A0ABW5PQI5_9BACI|nr:exonuclease SbcCD subunit D [Terrilactibacillus laevilacticus]
MRILHTADWHLGKTLEGRSRQREQEAVMDEICQIADDQKVDAIMMAGDVYDTVNPPAVSESLFYETAHKLSKEGSRPFIVISGNHDSPERIQASSPLASYQGITLVGHPIDHILKIKIPSKQIYLNISAIPYPSESRLNEVLSLSNDDEHIQDAYNDRLHILFKEHAKSFQKEAVNIMMSHLFVAGGKESDSERPIQVGGAYTVSPQAFPKEAQYVALGHLHRPQTLKHSSTLTRYAGSPLAYSFSEANQPKSVTILNVEPGEKATMNEIYLSSGKPLVKWRAKNGLDEIHRWLDEGRDSNSWIDLEVQLSEALSIHDIQEIRKLHDGIVNIRPIYLNDIEQEERLERMRLPIHELFIRFFKQQTNGAEPSPELLQLFLDLINENHDEAMLEVAAGRDEK